MSKYEKGRNDLGRVKINLLNDIKGNNLKLKRISPKKKSKNKPKDNRVPSLQQVQEALSSLNQTNTKLY